MAHPLEFLLPVEERDVRLVLVLPPVEGEPAAGEGAATAAATTAADGLEKEVQRASKVQKQADGEDAAGASTAAEAAAQAAAPGTAAAEAAHEVLAAAPGAESRREVLHANLVLLKSSSRKFRDWAARWAEGDAREYVVQCRDEAEVESYRQLLAFLHSMGRELPQDPGSLLRLLVLAREHTVEAAVMACVQRLQEQAGSLPALICTELWSVLSTGASGEAAIQAAADKLAQACFDRLCTLLAADGSLQDAAEQQALLRMLGPLQGMLNDERLRKLWRAVPLRLLQDCVLAEGNVQADSEATVLAACLYWAEGQEGLTDSQLSQLFRRIRFPDVPAATLFAYHRTFPSLQRFDPDKELLLRAATDPAPWTGLRDAMAAAEPPAPIAAIKAKCERWWQPRTAPLGRAAPPASFEFQCRKPDGDAKAVYSSYSYWNACWWRILLDNEDGATGAFLMPATSLDRAPPASDGERDMHPGMQVAYKIFLSRGAEEDAQVTYTDMFAPSHGSGWGTLPVKDFSAPDRPGLTWEAFWGEGSPYCRDGVVRGRFTLSLPPT